MASSINSAPEFHEKSTIGFHPDFVKDNTLSQFVMEIKQISPKKNDEFFMWHRQ
jgi:hypothetical protein